MKIRLAITLKKGDGPGQDADTIVDRLIEDIEAMGDVWVQDEEHDDETSYEVESVVRIGG